MNKKLTKVIACTMAVGTVLAGGTVMLNTPAQAATSTVYSSCNKKHNTVFLDADKSKGTITIKEGSKTYSYKYQSKDTTYKKIASTKVDKNGTKSWTETKDTYLYVNGKKVAKLKRITRKATQKKGANKPTYSSTKVIYAESTTKTNVGKNHKIEYLHTKKGANTLSITLNNLCKCNSGTFNRKYSLTSTSAKHIEGGKWTTCISSSLSPDGVETTTTDIYNTYYNTSSTKTTTVKRASTKTSSIVKK